MAKFINSRAFTVVFFVLASTALGAILGFVTGFMPDAKSIIEAEYWGISPHTYECAKFAIMCGLGGLIGGIKVAFEG